MITVVSHFFNEEYLLPWWLDHHKRIFDHGIMIDYRSTDRSREIIQEICPTWQIVTTRNSHFDSDVIDREVEDYEQGCEGWRMALNVTEFLYGNLNHLANGQTDQHYYLGNYVFTDHTGGQGFIPGMPLHLQRTQGYRENDLTAGHRLNTGSRSVRSIHNYARKYHPLGGRHWTAGASFEDLAIFYYGYADTSEANIARKLQIKNNVSLEEQQRFNGGHPNVMARQRYLEVLAHHQHLSSDLTQEIENITGYNYDR
jgi:hypothetical protein